MEYLVNNIKKNIKDNYKCMELILLYSLLCYGFMLVNHTISIDEETKILSGVSAASWGLQGRFGISVFNKILTDNGKFVPFMWDFLAVFLWSCAGIILYYGIFGKRVNKMSLFAFGAYFVSIPSVAGAVMSFSMFNLQVSCAMVILVMGFLFGKQFSETKKSMYLLWEIIFLAISFSIYQAFVGVYITIVVAYCLNNAINDEKTSFRVILWHAVACVLATVIYYVLDFFVINVLYDGAGNASYITDTYIGWGKGKGFATTLIGALKNLSLFLFNINAEGRRIYGGTAFSALNVIFILYVLISLMNKKKEIRSLILFYLVSFMLAPFLIYIVLGTQQMQGRFLLGISVLGAVEVGILVNASKGIIKNMFFILISYLLFLNARNMNMLYYYGNIVYQHDKTIANEIMYDVKRLGADYHNKPLVFVGMCQMDDIPIERYETLGGSIFEWDGGNNKRIHCFLETEGYKTILPTVENIKEASVLSSDMSVWPQNDSVREYDRFIVVYLSWPSDQWYGANGVDY